MNQKGLATAVTAMIVLVIVFAAGAGIYFATRVNEEPGGLSIYPGSQGWEITSEFPSEFYSELHISGDVDIVGYCVEGASIQRILNWYKNQMAGWTLEGEIPAMDKFGMTLSALLYKKGLEGAEIVAMGETMIPGTCYILVTGPWSAWSASNGHSLNFLSNKIKWVD